MIISTKHNEYYFNLNDRKLLFLDPLTSFLFKQEKKTISHIEQKKKLKEVEKSSYIKNLDSEGYNHYACKLTKLKKTKILDFSTFKHPKYEINLSKETIDANIANLSQVTFEITEKCNLRCVYCGYGEMYETESHYKDNELSYKSIKLFLDYLNKKRIENNVNKMIAIRFYGGEPLIKVKLIKKIVCYSNKLFGTENLNYGLTTNGMLLNESNIEYLVRNNFKISISLDGNEKENSYRIDINGRNSFSTIINNLNNLKNTCSEKYFNDNLKVFSVLHDRNANDYSNYIFKKYNIKPKLFPLSDNNVKSVYMDKFKKMNSYKNFYEDVVLNLFKEHNFDNHLSLISKENPIEETKRFPTSSCMPFSFKIFITVNGEIKICEQNLKKNVPVFGMIKNNNVCIYYNEVIEFYNKEFQPYIKLCSRCYNTYCTKCIFQKQISNNKASLLCQEYLDKNALKRQIVRELNTISKRYRELNKTLSSFQCMYIEDYTHICIKGNKCLLFNTLDGHSFFSNDIEIVNLISRMIENKNFLNISEITLSKNKLTSLILNLRKKFLIEIITVKNGNIPVFIPKVHKINRNNLVFDPMSNLNRLIIHLDDEFLSMFRGKECSNVKNKQLTLEQIKFITENLSNSTIRVIEIFAFSSFTDDIHNIMVYLKSKTDLTIILNTTMENYIEAIKIRNIKNIKIKLHVIPNIPKCSDMLNFKIKDNLEFIFIVESKNQFFLASEMVKKYNIRKYKFKPIYNGNNIDFFEDSILFDQYDFIGRKYESKEIFANSIINRNFFGNIYILPDGSVKASILDEVCLGKINDGLLGMLKKACLNSSNWFLTRSKVSPCKDCCFSGICPPISEYELQIGKYNLCKIYS